MACGEPNRLAQGLVRSEIRGLLDTTEHKVLTFAKKVLKARINPYFSKRRKLPESEVRKIYQEGERFLKDELKAFRFEECPDVQDMIQGFYWSLYKDGTFTSAAENLQFNEDSIELHMLRLYADRKRAAVDLFNCNLSITFHTLQRMIEREEVAEQPLAYLGSRSEEILAFAFLSMLFYPQNGESVAIPLEKGYLVGQFMTFWSDGIDEYLQRLEDPFRLRLLADVNGFHTITPHNVRTFKTREGKPFGLRFSTYISEEMCYEQQSRMLLNLREFREKHERALKMIPRIMFVSGLSNENLGIDPEDSDTITRVFEDYRAIFQSEDWNYSLNR